MAHINDHVNMTRISEIAEEDRDFYWDETTEHRRDRVHQTRIGELLPQVADPAAREILALLAIGVRAREV